jgi:putative colanic acid biosynthesis acetyltransferase WcaF
MTDGIAKTDVAANRSARKWTRKELGGRVLWTLATPAFRLSPRLMWGWRRWLLRRFGARIGREVQIYPSVRIIIPWNLSIGHESAIGDRATLYALGPIGIGERVTVSQGAHLCAGTHDWRQPHMPLIKSPIKIGDNAWICADAFVGPDVSIGMGAILGARAVAMRDIPENGIAVGNPAKVVSTRTRNVRPSEDV